MLRFGIGDFVAYLFEPVRRLLAVANATPEFTHQVREHGALLVTTLALRAAMTGGG